MTTRRNFIQNMAETDVKISFSAPKFQQTKQMDAFAENILNRTALLASGTEGLIDREIIDAVKQAADSGRAVKMSWK